MAKEMRRKLGRAMWLGVFKIFTVIARLIPLSMAYFLGNFLAHIAFFAAKSIRKTMLEGLTVAFPDVSVKKRKKIALDSTVALITGVFEFVKIFYKPQLLKQVSIEGKQFLTQALEKNKGVIVLTAHVGNFPLMLYKLAHEGYPVNVIIRPSRHEQIGNYLNDLRTKVGVKTIYSRPRWQCVNKIIKALHQNELVFILMDQDAGKTGIWVKFFGKLAATVTSPILLALRTQAVVIPIYIHHDKRKHIIKVFPEEEFIMTNDRKKTIFLNTIKFTKIIEQWIRQFPEQWTWTYRRWKTPPVTMENDAYMIEKDECMKS